MGRNPLETVARDGARRAYNAIVGLTTSGGIGTRGISPSPPQYGAAINSITGSMMEPFTVGVHAVGDPDTYIPTAPPY